MMLCPLNLTVAPLVNTLVLWLSKSIMKAEVISKETFAYAQHLLTELTLLLLKFAA
jgi:hypothetical protein